MDPTTRKRIHIPNYINRNERKREENPILPSYSHHRDRSNQIQNGYDFNPTYKPKADVTCFTCGDKGHYSTTCTKKEDIASRKELDDVNKETEIAAMRERAN